MCEVNGFLKLFAILGLDETQKTDDKADELRYNGNGGLFSFMEWCVGFFLGKLVWLR
jgi:hypothetical protein